MPIVSKNMEDVTEKQVSRLVELTWKAFDEYEKIAEFPHTAKDTVLYGKYVRRKNEAEEYKYLYPWAVPNFP